MSPFACANSAVVRTSAAAPSQMPDALPAVTTPSFLKTGPSFASVSSVVCGRGCSSLLKLVVPFFETSVDGSISSLKSPRSSAEAQRCWLDERELVARLARDAVLRREVLRRDGHRRLAVAVGERRPERVLELRRLAERESLASPADHVRRLRHVLRAADEHRLVISPRRSCWAPWTIASNPEPQRRLTVRAGVVMGSPAFSPMWRAQ